MNVILGYNYDLGKWETFDVQTGPLTPSAATYKRFLIEPNPYIMVIESPNGDCTTVRLADGCKLPHVSTLEDSIQRNKNTSGVSNQKAWAITEDDMKRYYTDIDSLGRIVEREHPEGDWVKWEDVEPLLSKLEAQRDALSLLLTGEIGET